ncbi:RraA family protein [Haloarcula amylovorans]|uniref:RraA family protein n=1 Tax=Haloarcula amylovorans TaxID=2562280 RepID=UPI0010764A0E|nr:RraA family protein [Halomicroarcula amylolytica]
MTETEILTEFEDLYTPAIADVLHDYGYEEQTLSPEITPLEQGMRILGTAFPIVGRPNRSVDADEVLGRFLEMHEDVPEDGVMIYDTNDDTSAHLGELEVTSLQPEGVAGAVIDGGVRDTSVIRERGFPVFNRYTSPVDCIFRWELLDWNTEAVVGGVRVSPGDVVVGDDDGVVVVPEDVATDVAADAQEMVSSEDAVRDALEAGVEATEAYEEHGTF